MPLLSRSHARITMPESARETTDHIYDVLRRHLLTTCPLGADLHVRVDGSDRLWLSEDSTMAGAAVEGSLEYVTLLERHSDTLELEHLEDVARERRFDEDAVRAIRSSGLARLNRR